MSTVDRTIRWIEQVASEALQWNQLRVHGDGEDVIDRPSVRTSRHLVSRPMGLSRFTVERTIEKVEASGHIPTFSFTRETIHPLPDEIVQVPETKYLAGDIAKMEAITKPIWNVLSLLFGKKWPITWFHYDVATQQCQYRYKVAIGSETEERSGSTQDESVLQACVDACEVLARFVSVQHGHDIRTTPVTRVIEEPAPESDVHIPALDTEDGASLG